VALGISRHFGAGYGIAFLVLMVVFIRFLSYILPIPINFREFELFNPTVYGSSVVLKTLGDLFLNALLFVWIVLFARIQINKYDFKLNIRNQPLQYLIAGILSALLVTLTF